MTAQSERNRRRDLTTHARHKDSGIRTGHHAQKRGERRATNVELSKFAWDALDALIESL
jgi:hypothetical protein